MKIVNAKFRILKDLPAAIRYMRSEGLEVEKASHQLNSRPCYHVHGEAWGNYFDMKVTDYELLEWASCN